MSIADWIRMDQDCSAEEYIQKLQRGYWGGTLDLVCLARILHRDIEVFMASEKRPLLIETSSPQCSKNTRLRKKTIQIAYNGSNHYDAIESD